MFAACGADASAGGGTGGAGGGAAEGVWAGAGGALRCAGAGCSSMGKLAELCATARALENAIAPPTAQPRILSMFCTLAIREALGEHAFSPLT